MQRSLTTQHLLITNNSTYISIRMCSFSNNAIIRLILKIVKREYTFIMNIVYLFLLCINHIVSCVNIVISCVNPIPSCVHVVKLCVYPIICCIKPILSCILSVLYISCYPADYSKIVVFKKLFT